MLMLGSADASVCRAPDTSVMRVGVTTLQPIAHELLHGRERPSEVRHAFVQLRVSPRRSSTILPVTLRLRKVGMKGSHPHSESCVRSNGRGLFHFDLAMAQYKSHEGNASFLLGRSLEICIGLLANICQVPAAMENAVPTQHNPAHELAIHQAWDGSAACHLLEK